MSIRDRIGILISDVFNFLTYEIRYVTRGQSNITEYF